MIIHRGINPEVHDTEGWTALNLASLAGKLVIVHFLVAVGANIESQQHNGQTPLGSACLNGHLDVILYLLSLDPPSRVDVYDKQGGQPLHYAAQYGFTKICRALLESGADVNTRAMMNGWTALHAASAAGHVDTVKLLIDWNADRWASDYTGQSPSEVVGSTRRITRRARLLLQCLLDPEMAETNRLCPQEERVNEPEMD